MNKQQFLELAAEGYELIPLARTLFADFDTPLSVYCKLANVSYSYLLESVQGGEKWGRYSFIGLQSDRVIAIYGHQIKISENRQPIADFTVDDPLQWIAELQGQFRVPQLPNLPRFLGGLVGYFGYDTVRYIEPRLKDCPHPDPLGLPDILLLMSRDIIAFDNLKGTLQIITLVNPSSEDAYEKAQAKLDGLAEQLVAPLERVRRPQNTTAGIDERDFQASFDNFRYEQAVEKIKEYIRAGDCMQVVPSQRLTIEFTAPPLDLYRALRMLNPSPYMYFLHLDDFYIVGSSPEILVRLEDDLVTVRPIAGTRPRGKTEAEDLDFEKDLLSDPKEIAEHVMLIDLGRNDVGRIAEIGTVTVTDKMVIERYSHVMHIVSNVTGRLKPNMDAIEVLRATFPAGTVSGAPKIRAMEIIDELEPVKRGIYAGAVGYLSWSGNMDLAIAIRTGVLKDGKLFVQAGGGIVADSQASAEWEETLNKRRALFRAADLAARGLD